MHNAVVRAPRPRRSSEEVPARLPTRGPHDAPRAQAGAEGPDFNTEGERAIKAQSERRFLIDLRKGKGQPSVQMLHLVGSLPSLDASVPRSFPPSTVHRPEVVSGVQGHAARRLTRAGEQQLKLKTKEARGNRPTGAGLLARARDQTRSKQVAATGLSAEAAPQTKWPRLGKMRR